MTAYINSMHYAQWLQRATEFTDGMRRLPGKLKVEFRVAPPLSDVECDELAQSCRLPIPPPLRRFWTEASGHCHCTYWWETPAEFHEQLRVAASHWSASHVWGGPKFESAQDVVELTRCFIDWAEEFRDEYPKDARIWEYSLPLLPVGNGDYVGLYVKDELENPPVSYLCHEGCGASDIISPTFDEFLAHWEQLDYIGLHFLFAFLHRRSGRIEPDAFPVEREALRALCRGEVRRDLVKPPRAMTASDWMSCEEPTDMLDELEKRGTLDERKRRLFCCACCRRMWDRMGPMSRGAVETAERFADGLASRTELDAAQAELDAAQAELDAAQAVSFPESEGAIHFAARSALTASTWITWHITQHLDEPELHAEKMAHSDLVRHIFGNPNRNFEVPAVRRLDIARLAKRLHEGDRVAGELHDALDEGGYPELAEHFLRPDHPKGCWALDLILGK